MNTTAYLFFVTLISLFYTTLKSLFFIGFTFVSNLCYNNIFHHHYSPTTLNDDIIFFHILNQLPPKSLFRLSCVSKLWYNAIHHDPFFIASHFNHSKSKPSRVFISTTSFKTHFIKYLDDLEHQGDNQGVSFYTMVAANFKKKRRKVIGSVNGLTCFSTVYFIEICNTSTHEILGIPYPPAGDAYDICWNGFGFDPLMNQYKVMRITRRATKLICQIFTLGPRAQDCIWRDITSTSHPPNLLEWDVGICKEPLIFSNGALFKVIPSTNTIIMFDIHYETFQMIPGLQTSGCADMMSFLYTVCEFRGCPYAVYRGYVVDAYEFSFYALKKEEQGSSSSSNSNVGSNIQFVFEQAIRFPMMVTFWVLLSFTEFSGQILVQWYDVLNNIQFYVYNPHTDKLQREEVSLDSHGYSALFVEHIDNLLSLRKLVPMSPHGAPATTEVKYLSSREATMHDDEGSSTTLSPMSMLCCFGFGAKKHRQDMNRYDYISRFKSR